MSRLPAVSPIFSPSECSYWFKAANCDWKKVSKEDYIQAERNAGFKSKKGPDFVATDSFSSSITNTRGRITYASNTPEQYDWDPDFASVMREDIGATNID